MIRDMAYTSVCKKCGAKFTRSHPGIYCSLACRGLAQTDRCTRYARCKHCYREFLVSLSYLSRGTKFCSRLCYEQGRDRIPLEKRFWKFVTRNGPKECWEWTGGMSTHGYGKIATGGAGNSEVAHRVSYRIKYGQIPNGLQINHRCDNRKCVNPRHLYAGTAKDNTHDSMARGRWRSPFVK